MALETLTSLKKELKRKDEEIAQLNAKIEDIQEITKGMQDKLSNELRWRDSELKTYREQLPMITGERDWLRVVVDKMLGKIAGAEPPEVSRTDEYGNQVT